MTATRPFRPPRHASGLPFALALVIALGLSPRSHATRPACSAGGPYISQCDGTTLTDASASDADGDALTFLWEGDCDGDGAFGEPGDGTFDDATLLNAVFHAPDGCGSTCTVRLTASDRGGSPCLSTTTVTVNDTTPPVIDFGGTLALGPADTYFPRTQQGGPMLHSHGMVYERPQLTVWWTDYELADNLYEFDATQPPGSTLTALSQLAVPAGGIEDITFDPNDQSLWYIDLSGIVHHIDQTGVPLPPLGGFATGGQFGLAWANGFLWVEDPNIGSTQYTLAGAPTGRTIPYTSPPEYGLGYDFDRDLLWTGGWNGGAFRAYDEDTGALVFTSPVIVLPDGNGIGHDVGYGACRLWVGTESLAEDVIYAIPIEGDVCDISVECDEIPSADQPTATDNCASPLPVVVDEDIIPGNCPNEYTIVRTWTATDACGNDTIRTQRISVFDSTPPQVSCPGPASFECIGDVLPCDRGDAAATDNCPPADVICLSDTDNGGAGCASDPLVITRTWRATDACGNTASCSQTITVVDDVPPSLMPGALAPCFATAAAAEAAALAATVVDDACLATIDVATLGGCAAIVRITATDSCGNTAMLDYPVLVDPAGPVLSARAPRSGCDVLLFADAEPGDVAIASPAVDVIDPCGATVENDRTPGGADATDSYPCGLTVVTFDAVDACGRTATCRVVVVVRPAAAPPSVGSALRVRKNAAGAPVLDWSLAGPGAGPRFCVMRAANDPRGLVVAPLARGLAALSWTEPAPLPRLLCYDVRSIDCGGALSAD